MDTDHLHELLYQALETELSGERVYDAAIACALNEDLAEEWEKYREETREHQSILGDVFAALDLDPSTETPGRQIVRAKADALVASMEMARGAGDPAAAELVAAEAVVDAETKDHQNWELLNLASEHANKETAKVLGEAYAQVAEEEAHHLFHTQGWARELWLQFLGVPAALPPPEEEKMVATKIGASRAEQQRDEYTD